MKSRSFKYKKGANPCSCGNINEFNAYSQQVSEDCCEVWITCYACGYDPTENSFGERFESMMGGTEDSNVLNAISVWNDLVCSNIE